MRMWIRNRDPGIFLTLDPGFFLTPDPGYGIEKNRSGIRDKHPGSATLLSLLWP